MHARIPASRPAELSRAPVATRPHGGRAGDLIRQTGELLAAYTDDQLAVIDDFLTRARQLTAAYASTLSGHHATASRQPPTGG